MRLSILMFTATAVFGGTPVAGQAVCGSRGTPASMLVSAGWLNQHLRDANLAILYVGDDGGYNGGHIPGSRNFDSATTHLMKSSTGLTLELPPTKQLEDALSNVGIRNDSRVVLYIDKKPYAADAARVFLTLEAAGLGAQTSILDGGLAAWTAGSYPLTHDAPPAAIAGHISLCQRDDVVTGIDYVSTHLKTAGVQIIDARAAIYYTGAQKPGDQRLGHIPGATNIPYTTLTDDSGRLLPATQLQALFHEAGAKPGDRIVSYCHIGLQGSLLYFAARLLGYDARLYDGSWEDWSAHANLPAELPGH